MEVLNIAKNLIKIPSVTDSDDESLPLLLIRNILEKEGREIKIKLIGDASKENLVAKIGRGKTSILLNGHIDVVPGLEKLFNPIIQNGKLYGRGSVDAKGPLSCLIKAFIDLSYKNLNSEIILTCVCDEENAGERGSRLVRKKGVVGNYNIIGEPTNLVPIMAEKGFVRIKVIAHGKSAHAAFPENGLNAIEQMSNVLPLLRRHFAGKDLLLGRATVNQSIISGGNRINVVPDYCETSFDIRYLPNQTPAELLLKVDRKLKEMGNYEIITLSQGDPVNFSHSSKLAQVVSKVLGPKIRSIAFATDARFFSDGECLILGPGKPEVSHQNQESVKIPDLYKAVEIYKSLVLKLMDDHE